MTKAKKDYDDCEECKENCTDIHDEKCPKLKGLFWRERQKSVYKDSVRKLSLCYFNDKRDKHCASQRLYDNLVKATNKANGSAWSDPDRREEWKATRLTICVLLFFLNDTALN